MAQYKMILDLDTGIDDALALAYAVGHPDIELIGIIASYGNNLTDVTAQNSLNLLDLLGASDVPVFYGASHSTTTDDFTVMEVSKTIHGQNGVGDVEVPTSPRQLAEQSGIDFLIDAAHEFKDQLVYLPTGPMTNLALALQKDPSIAQLIGQTTLMGGALTVPGNVTPFTEANINQDPEAADVVFRKQESLTMVGLDVTLRTLLTKKHTAEWRALGTQKGQLYADMMDYYIDAYFNLDIDKRGAALHDPLAVAVAVEPDYVETLPLNMKVTTDRVSGDYGRTIGNTDKLLDKTTSKAAVLVDQDRFVSDFQQMMLTVLSD
ncbi:nucleoside hydrolase [Fructobacillus fructosus]|uniref:Inosine-uridine nucleoside N-ribohydrolase (URH1) n=1 Tax=Fructobacillus fructosus TaxID=1631 RepID=A0ABN9YZP8_9LACO|nr:nucleoside hydrolase [Fructobacillus fructosus]MBD9366089.1 nucleoside hydrolase [Leuconostoc mesenteroides]MBC9119099.1 nucleoside hydrolase [Fructobacillus fructosus]MCK8638661.1 nucleoside hydrolase [Fructobacillus fructosus]CAK1242001.1 Inosine-uridine nucleoside N-ribohydrolase (URH1) [Fructobacillus fructosus]CAK1247202.1 Inosine-uridine nucleoside N-ribohydrolase (URH1) [Fructobacillus fructosus]